MDEKRNEITGNQVDGTFASVFLGRELPEQFGATIKDIKKPILLLSQGNISQEMAH
jgi:hypothetical protein